jgi:hypothetical protein
VKVKLKSFVGKREISLMFPTQFKAIASFSQAEAIQSPIAIAVSGIAVNPTFTFSLRRWIEMKNYSDFQMNRPQCSNQPTASSDEIC